MRLNNLTSMKDVMRQRSICSSSWNGIKTAVLSVLVLLFKDAFHLTAMEITKAAAGNGNGVGDTQSLGRLALPD